MKHCTDILNVGVDSAPRSLWGDGELDRTADGLVFVVGCPRSGTSLVHSILLSHPDFTLPPETHFMRLLYGFNEFAEEPGKAGVVEEVLERIRADAYQRQLGVDWDLFRRFVEKAPATWAGLFLAWLTAYRVSRGAVRIGEKTPRHYLYLEYLLKQFPEARVLFLLRDPRAVFNSYRKRALGDGNFWNASRIWLEAEQSLRGFQEGLDADRFFLVRYEALVESPDEVVPEVCRFLALSFNPSMLEPHKREDRGFKDCHYAHWKNTLKPIFSSSREAWRSELSSRQMAMLDFIDAEAMSYWGFEPTGKRTLFPGVQLAVSRYVYLVSPFLRRALRRFAKK